MNVSPGGSRTCPKLRLSLLHPGMSPTLRLQWIGPRLRGMFPILGLLWACHWMYPWTLWTHGFTDTSAMDTALDTSANALDASMDVLDVSVDVALDASADVLDTPCGLASFHLCALMPFHPCALAQPYARGIYLLSLSQNEISHLKRKGPTRNLAYTSLVIKISS